MPYLRFVLLLLIYSLLIGEGFAQAANLDGTRRQIEQTLTAQADAWNRGDIDGFMLGYAKTADLRFASGGNVTRGWQSTLDRYKARYPDRAAMGKLVFSELETTVLSSDAAVVFGHWKLVSGKGEPHGLFTLVFRKTAEGWRIVADHTSVAESAP